MIIHGYTGKLLRINLSNQTVDIEDIDIEDYRVSCKNSIR
jgi:aldehyde:ferredoxin oxidoreductase